MMQEAQLRDQEREVALKEAEEESRLQEQVFFWLMRIIYLWKQTFEDPSKRLEHLIEYIFTTGGGSKAKK